MLYEHIENECSNTEINCKECKVGSKRGLFNRHDPDECIENLHKSLENKDNEITYLKKQKIEAVNSTHICPHGHTMEPRRQSNIPCD